MDKHETDTNICVIRWIAEKTVDSSFIECFSVLFHRVKHEIKKMSTYKILYFYANDI